MVRLEWLIADCVYVYALRRHRHREALSSSHHCSEAGVAKTKNKGLTVHGKALPPSNNALIIVVAAVFAVSCLVVADDLIVTVVAKLS